MNKFLIYVNDEREALKMAKDFIFSFKKEMCDISQSNNKQGYIVLLINNSNFIYIVYDRNVILNNIISEKDFNRYRVYTTVYNTALLETASLFATEMQSDDILKSIKMNLQSCAYKGCINLQSLIKDVKFNPPATIVFWNDGTKTVVKSSEFDDYDPEKGFMLCIMKYLLKPQLVGGQKLRSYYKTITDYTDKFEEEGYVPGEWPEGYLKLLFNFKLDEESCDDNKSVNEPNLTYEKGINPELKVDENIEDTKSMIDIIVENARKTLKDLDKKMLNDIHGSRDSIDAMIYALEASESLEEQTSIGKDILCSIIDDVRNDPFNKAIFHGKRPDDIITEKADSMYFVLGDEINNVCYIHSSNYYSLYQILQSLYTLTSSEIILYYSKYYTDFAIRIGDVLILLLRNNLMGNDILDYYQTITNRFDKYLSVYNCSSLMSTEKHYFNFIEWVCALVEDYNIRKFKGKQ